tara:strand:+ start:40399 stop:40932 length:534 start_codon:yes stop_codon:yes gene_type:complete
MNPLPHSIINHIFSFILQPYEINLLNETNLELENVKILENKRKNHINLLKEFKAKTTFWRVKWLNKNLDLGSSGDEEENPEPRKYESTRAQLDFITTYWNYHYPSYYHETPLATGNNNCEEEYITDVNRCTRVLNHLKILKHYTWSDIHKGLFKPGINKRCRLVWMGSSVVVKEGDL